MCICLLPVLGVYARAMKFEKKASQRSSGTMFSDYDKPMYEMAANSKNNRNNNNRKLVPGLTKQ